MQNNLYISLALSGQLSEAGYVVNTLRTGCVPCAQGFFSDEPGAEVQSLLTVLKGRRRQDCQECGLGRYGVKDRLKLKESER